MSHISHTWHTWRRVLFRAQGPPCRGPSCATSTLDSPAKSAPGGRGEQAPHTGPVSFTGIPHAAAQFYADLEEDNTREFWAERKPDYEQHVLGPMQSLLADLEPDFGAPKVFRPHRDVRFSADKSPYKTHQGGYVPVAEATGWYVEVSADGLRVGAGCYQMTSERLATFRRAVAHDRTGTALELQVEALREGGWEIGGDRLKTAPRGVAKDHPRIDLLRHRSLTAMRWIEDGDIVTTTRLLPEIRAFWEELRPLVTWLAATDR